MMQSSQENWYRIYGLRVRSQLHLPEVATEAPGGTPDVDVRHGAFEPHVLDALLEGRSQKRWVGRLEDGTIWMDSLCACYQIRGGNHIVFTPKEENADPLLLRTFLLGSAFGFLLHQRGIYPIHGGAIVSAGKAVIITGDKGAGKSTITSALVKRGFSFLADDVSAVQATPQGALIHPAYPQRKLCRDAAIALDYDLNTLFYLGEDRDKFAIREAENWCPSATPLHWMIELSAQEGAPISVEPIQGGDALPLFLQSIYRRFYYAFAGMPPIRMQEVLNIVSNTHFFRLTHPGSIATLKDVTHAIAALVR